MAFLKFFKSSTFLCATSGAVLLWAALPPADLWPLAWIAPVPWIMLVRRKDLAGPKPYLALWTAGFFFWLITFHWLRLPFWALVFGWVGLADYFAFYTPLFIGLSRIAVHQLRWPVMLAAPAVWTGLEFARSHFLTGMSMAELSHTQYHWIEMIQIADLAGQYGVSFVIVFVAACLARMLPSYDACQTSSPPMRFTPRLYVLWPLVPAIIVPTAALGYGYWRIAGESREIGPRVALIQGSIDMTVGGEESNVRDKFYRHYFELSQKALREAEEKQTPLDLIVWPEIFFKEPLISFDADAGDNDPSAKEANLSGADVRRQLRYYAAQTEQSFANTAKTFCVPILVGTDTQHYTATGRKFFNSAAFVSQSGKLLGRYDKMHLVPFGEYFPFADSLPWLYCGIVPISGGMTPGEEPAAYDLEYASLKSPAEKKSIRFAPHICFECVLSHVIRGQINTLQKQKREPDVLINLSNDGWYWSSSELDMLFACAVFRAVECRKPFMMAANTGFSASIDGSGRALLKGPRHDAATLLADVPLDSRRSFYLQFGDWPAGICLACCIFFLGAGVRQRFRRKRAVTAPSLV